MSNLHNMSWMQFDCSEEMLLKIAALDAMHSRAVSIWIKAVIAVKNNGGTLNLATLVQGFISRHLSKKLVIDILAATEFFVLDLQRSTIRFSEHGLSCFKGSNAKKNSKPNSPCSIDQGGTTPPDTPHQGGTTPPDTAPNAPTRREERIENREKEENKKRGKETEGGDTLRLDEAQEREQLRAMERLRDLNYSPSEELLAKVPEQVKIHADKFWFPFACWLYDEQGMQRWQEAWAMHGSDTEFVDLVRRHWSETVTCFIEHAIIYGQFDKINSKNDIQCKLGLYLRPERMPARQLRAKLNAKELRQQATDPRELRFYDFMDQHCPHLVQMEQALTYPQFDALRQQYGKERVLNVLRDMENDPKLHKRDCCATAKKWLERPPRSPQGGRTGS